MVIEVDNSPTSSKDINNLVDNAIAKDSAISPIPEDNSLPSLNISPSDPLKKDTPATDPTTDDLTNILSPLALRCSGRERKIPSRFALTTIDDISTCDNSNIAFIAVAGEPKTYQEAIQLPHSKQWEQAVKFKYVQLQKLGIFEVVDGLPNGRKAIGSRIVFHEKRDGHGNLVKFKAHIVAKGFSQIPGEDFTNTFSSVAKFSTLRIFFSYIAYLDWYLHHVDVVAAYLHGPLDEDIYMTIPNGVENSSSGRYWKLKKVLYGLKQARR